MTIYFRMETGSEDRESPTFGPYEWLQLTYNELRTSPEGATIAFLDSLGDWRFDDTHPDSATQPDQKWSDVIIWTQEVKL